MKRYFICLFLSIHLLCAAFINAAWQKDEITLLAVGDIMLSRHIGKVMAKKGNDYPFEQIAPTIKKGDIVFGNLESILGKSNDPPFFSDNPYNFLAVPDAAKTLKGSGFTVLNLANNHAMDFGSSPILQTRELLKKEGIEAFGAGKDLKEARKPAIVEVNGLRFAFLGYSIIFYPQARAGKNNAGVSPIRLAHIKKDIQAVRSKADFVIVSFHWGEEYHDLPNQKQRDIAHQTIDWGADMILGHHPHVLQGIELYKDKVIAYSLGNFIFDQKGDGKDRSIILSCIFRGKALRSVEITPLDRFNTYYPKIAEGQPKQEILEKMRAISLPLNSDPTALKKIGLPDKIETAGR